MRDFLVGNIAVGIIIVDGKAGTEAEFTSGEILTVATEVSQAFDVLYRLKSAVTAGVTPVPLFFMAQLDRVQIDLDPASVPALTTKAAHVNTLAEYERYESVWRDPALQALGYAAGQGGINQHIGKLMTRNWFGGTPDAAYVAFFTKYMANWMAYANQSMGRVVMCYPWLADLTASNADGTGGFRNTGATGWGATNIDRVFAHESCHIFGAPDEYASSNCSTTATSGHLGVANSNCEVGNASSVACLMKTNTEAMCSATPGHLGWIDTDSNGVLDVLQ